MEIKIIEHLKETLLNVINNPDLDVDIFFKAEDNTPYVKVRYITEEHNIHEKEIDIHPEYLNMDTNEIVNFVLFQIQQFMEEIDSVEYGGE